ncbi:hypothetical protein [Frigoriflavimonas asaccharolytica]|uniref:GLPGLI family protein n=1 Tax=Frigoriflavimonas asaccharolytica TaxID=2735899 RepID=A0A8J8K4S0_9FLAO|nr:hypothetical protein [Frigoriflavimonas asaccharolytica]NRS92040.1 hypothetical protein [Frigoriflavimonas asaccharolytica]
MKKLFLLFAVFSFGLLFSQNQQEFIFKFKVKKWQKEFKKHQKNKEKGTSILNLFDTSGRKINFDVQEKNISEVKMKDILNVKGKSLDHSKIITLTLFPKSMSGSYLENGRQYFIEPVKDKCNTYKVYINPTIDKDVEVGQLKDFVE